VDRFRKGRTLTEHHAQEREGGKTQSLGVKLVDGQFQAVALLQGARYGRTLGLIFQCRADGAKSFEDIGFVGVVFVRDGHSEGGEILTRRSVRFLVRGDMGIRERQSRERETVRRKILNAARTLFLNEGYANVSMRKIAEQIEYSPGAIYSYFTSKEDIFFALAEEGLQFVRAHCGSAPHANSALERVRGAFWRFYTFSKEQPEYFSLIFVDSAVPRISRDWERFSSMRELRHDVEQDIQQCIDEGVFPRVDAPGAVFRLLWTAAYGVAVFRLSHRLAPGEDSDALAHDLLDAAIAGLRAGIDLHFSAASDTREPLDGGEGYSNMETRN
jgi:AcrR family transcriptional regulator